MIENFTPNAVAKLKESTLTDAHRNVVESATLNADRGVYEVTAPQADIDALMGALRGDYAAHVAAGGAPYAQH